MKIEEKEINAPYELPDGWQWTDVGSIAEIINGKSQKEVEDDNGLYPIYGSGGIIGRARDFICPENCTIIGRKGTINNPIFVETKFWNVDTAFGMKPFDSVNPKFYFYFCKNFNFSTLDSSTAIPSLTKTNIQKIPFPLPPLSEQQRIVSRIESMFAKLDEATEKAESALESFETRKAAILHKAFTGELTAKWRKDNGVSEDSWEEKTLNSVCIREITDGTHKTPTYVDEANGIPFISGKDVSNEVIDWSDLRYIPKELHEELYARLAPQVDDILLSKNGARLGKAAIVETSKVFDIYVTLALLRPNKEIVFPKFLWRIINSPICQTQIQEHLTGIGMPNLHLRDIKSFIIKVPTLNEQKEIVRILDSVLEKERIAKEAAETVLSQIALLKKSILARAFRGEL